ncbi:MAG: hypothetical protein ACJ740_13500 [Gaiellales bacterium]|jgi:hypothetical protein|nr:hypothetical protein [Gaiellales bacterium]
MFRRLMRNGMLLAAGRYAWRNREQLLATGRRLRGRRVAGRRR